MSVVYRALVEKLGAASTATFVGNEGELFWDPTSTDIRISDGTTVGGAVVSGGSSGAPTAKGYINMNGNSPTWTGTSGYTVAHSGGGGLDELYTLTFPTAYSARTDYIVHATYDGTDWVYVNGAQVAVARFTDKVVFTVRRWNEDPLNLGDIMVTIHNL